MTRVSATTAIFLSLLFTFFYVDAGFSTGLFDWAQSVPYGALTPWGARTKGVPGEEKNIFFNI
jgi:hypothetical protein